MHDDSGCCRHGIARAVKVIDIGEVYISRLVEDRVWPS